MSSSPLVPSKRNSEREDLMKLHKSLTVLCVCSMMGSIVQAAPFTFTNTTDAINQVSKDSTLLSGWINDQFKDAAAFNSTAGDVVPSQLKIFGIEFGVEGVATASKVDVDGLHNLGTELIDTTKIKMYDRMPFPSVLGHAKIGLPFGLDAGIRIGGIPSKSLDNGDTHFDIANSIFGLDVRKKIIEEGMTRPFGLTMGLNYTHAKGHIDVDTPYTANMGNVLVGGQTYTPSFNATGNERTDWDTNSVGVQAILNKKILILNPYIGAAANHNSGTVSSSINNVGNLILTEPGLPTLTQALTAGGSASASPDNWDLRALAGLEITILPFVKLGINGELANEGRYGGDIGLRIQFR
jgi:hypothetical protein